MSNCNHSSLPLKATQLYVHLLVRHVLPRSGKVTLAAVEAFSLTTASCQGSPYPLCRLAFDLRQHKFCVNQGKPEMTMSFPQLMPESANFCLPVNH